LKFFEILRYELEHRVRSGSTWVFAVFMVALGVLTMLDAGAIDAIHANAPTELASSAAEFVLLSLVVFAAIFGDAAVRDYDAGMDPLLFTAPLRKFDYLGGRYLSALITSAVLLLGIPIGCVATILIGYPDPAHYGPIRIAAFLQPWLIIQVPMVALAGAALMTAGVLSRRLVPVFFMGIVVFLALVAGANDGWTAARIDTLGLGALHAHTESWTASERNTRLIGLPVPLLWNRALWLAITAGAFYLLHAVFRFQHRDGFLSVEKVSVAPTTSMPAPLATVTKEYGWRAVRQQTLAVARNSLAETLNNLWFVALLAACVIASMVLAGNVGSTPFDTSTWPATSLIVGSLARFGVPVIGIVAAILAGEMVWNDRTVRADEIADALPVTEAVALGGRFIALLAIVAMFLTASTVGGMLIQVSRNYFHLEPTVYLRVLFGAGFANIALIVALTLTIHVLVNHKYLGHFVALAAVGFTMAADSLVRNRLLIYGSDQGLVYSDMNGFGPFLAPFVWFKLYWAGWAVLLIVAACVLWARDRESGLRRRLARARTRFTGPKRRTAALGVALASAAGGFIVYNTNILNTPVSEDADEVFLAQFEKRYGQFEGAAQPTIESAQLRIELYPEKAAVHLSGAFRLVNRSGTPIDSIHVTVRPNFETRSISFDRAATAVVTDVEHGYRIYDLASPLAPGDSLQLRFDIDIQQRGFPNGSIQTDIVENGTYFERGWLPFVGYQPSFELTDGATRLRSGLEPRPPVPGPAVVAARRYRYELRNEDRVRVEAIVGTSSDQIAITSGKLERQWTENGRRYFQYETEVPQSFAVPVLSGKYAVHSDRWQDSASPDQAINLEIYHHATRTTIETRARWSGRSRRRSTTTRGNSVRTAPTCCALSRHCRGRVFRRALAPIRSSSPSQPSSRAGRRVPRSGEPPVCAGVRASSRRRSPTTAH
jgi:ABC-type transport system involved in multi-copper enzyme maturation permease subunit